jgi:hypothetical protein
MLFSAGTFHFLEKKIETDVHRYRWVGLFFCEKKIEIRGTTSINTRKELKVFRTGSFVGLGRGIRCVGSMM